jgi:hypothetical protein
MALAAALAGCGKVSPDDCTKMVEHYLDLVMAEDPSVKGLPPQQVHTVREVKGEVRRGDPSYRRVYERCDSVTRSEYRCAMGADTSRAWEECLKGKP